jgi:hypothetical protein
MFDNYNENKYFLYTNDEFEEDVKKSEFNFVDSFCGEPPPENDAYSFLSIFDNILANSSSTRLHNKCSQKNEKQKKISFINHKIGSIFKIIKMNKSKNKKIGRIKKNMNICFITKHNKFSQDNIIRKIKRKFTESCRKYINYIYKQYLLKNKEKDKNDIKDCFLRKVSPEIVRQIKKSENIKWLNTKLRDVYSVNISYCNKNEKDYNIKNIEELYKEGKAIDIINLLNRTVKDLFVEYCSNEKKEGFKKLDDDILRIKNKMIKENEEQIEEYIRRYKYIATHFENIFMDKIERKDKEKESPSFKICIK